MCFELMEQGKVTYDYFIITLQDSMLLYVLPKPTSEFDEDLDVGPRLDWLFRIAEPNYKINFLFCLFKLIFGTKDVAYESLVTAPWDAR